MEPICQDRLHSNIIVFHAPYILAFQKLEPEANVGAHISPYFNNHLSNVLIGIYGSLNKGYDR